MSRSRGSAPVDFVLVCIPLLSIALTTASVIFSGYARNIAQDIAIDSARYGALADQDVFQAQVRGQQALDSNLSFLAKPRILVNQKSNSNFCEVEASVSLSLVAVGPLNAATEIKETGVAACEVSG